MYQLFCSSALFIVLLLGVSANYLREVSQQQRTDSVQFKNQKNDYFPEPPYCGVGKSSKAPNHIYGRTEVEEGEFPWMVSFLPMECGGTLINSRWVLSAARCLDGHSPEDVKAYLGTLKIANNDAEFAIENVINHEQYDGSIYDIALVKLRASVTFNNKIQPICLPYNNEAGDSSIVGQDAVVSGWLDYSRRNDLLKSTVSIWSARKCGNHIQEYDGADEFVVAGNHFICAGEKEGVDTCTGVLGGPLFLQLHSSEDDDKNEHYYQVGIASFGAYYCATDYRAGIYANVSTYIPWIRRTILANE